MTQADMTRADMTRADITDQGKLEIFLARPRGFCAGVDRAIAIVERALALFGPPIHVRHEVVHNRSVVQGLEDKGAVFVETLDEVPDHAIVIFSAHGVSKAVRRAAEARGLTVFDATCPLVTKVHMEVSHYQREGRECVLIGHAGHPEVEGTLGQYERAGGGRDGGAMYLVESTGDVVSLEVGNPQRLAFVTQTTLSMDDTAQIIDALRARFPAIRGPKKDDICYATQNRQDAVKKLAPDCELFIVVGSQNSSNSNRLREIAAKLCPTAYLVDNSTELDRGWFDGVGRVGVTAGASAPETLVQEVVGQIIAWGGEYADEIVGRQESVVFSLPKGLQIDGDAVAADHG